MLRCQRRVCRSLCCSCITVVALHTLQNRTTITDSSSLFILKYAAFWGLPRVAWLLNLIIQVQLFKWWRACDPDMQRHNVLEVRNPVVPRHHFRRRPVQRQHREVHLPLWRRSIRASNPYSWSSSGIDDVWGAAARNKLVRRWAQASRRRWTLVILSLLVTLLSCMLDVLTFWYCSWVESRFSFKLQVRTACQLWSIFQRYGN